MKIIKSSVPTKAGYYFVKLKTSAVWQLFIEVIGVKPFMGVNNIHVISGSDTILGNLLELDWSRPIDLGNTEETIEGFVITSKIKNQIISYLKAGSKLEAVKYLKEESRGKLKNSFNNTDSLGIREVKDYCDKLQVDLNIQY